MSPTARLRNHAIGSYRIRGWANIASGLRWAAHDYANAITLVDLVI